ncbi:MAG: hypothetical protein ACRDPY_44290 [Streptosporangiaceae bacterium]
MMPGIDPRNDARKKRVRDAAFIGGGATMAYVALSATRFRVWEWVPLAVGLIIIIVIAVAGIAGPGGRGRGSGLGGRGRDDGEDRPAGAPAHRWHMLVMVSRLMPRSAGRRWLAEADSLLSEIAAARRGAAIRSYLLSAPRLVVMIWAREALRRARLGPRQPG